MIKVEIPKEGIRLYAMMKAHELKNDIELKTDEQAINYLKSIGIEIINTKDEIIAEFEAELKKYKDMAAKGLEEFKDVGGCWGCGLQLQLNQDLEDIKHLKAENEQLKKENINLLKEIAEFTMANRMLKEVTKSQRQTLQEIKAIAEKTIDIYYPDYYDEGFEEDIVTEFAKQVLDLITKVEEINK